MNGREGLRPGGDGVRRHSYCQRSTVLDGPPRIETGVTELHDVLNGGLPQGHLYLLEDDPGMDKTTAALQFLLAGVRNMLDVENSAAS